MGSTPAKGTYSASRCAAVIGLNQYQTPREIWQILCEENEPGFNEKHDYKYPEFKESAAIRWGHAFEESVIKLASQKFNSEIINQEKFFSRQIGEIILSCHIDGNFKLNHVTDINSAILHEGKTTNARAYHSSKEEKQRWGDPGTDQVPEEYQVQCAIQRICTGADLVRLSVLVFPKTSEDFEELGWRITKDVSDQQPFWLDNEVLKINSSPHEWARTFSQIGNFHSYNLPKNEPLESAIIKKIQEFDSKYVKTQIPPPAEDYDDIRRLLSNPIGTVIATKELKELACLHSELTYELGKSGPGEKNREAAKVKIMDTMMNSAKDDWSNPNKKIILIDPDGGRQLASYSLSGGFRSFKAEK